MSSSEEPSIFLQKDIQAERNLFDFSSQYPGVHTQISKAATTCICPFQYFKRGWLLKSNNNSYGAVDSTTMLLIDNTIKKNRLMGEKKCYITLI